MSLVSIRDVRKSFGANEVLKGVSLDIAKGDVVAIIGRSGSGKSTLLRCINGLETYQSGSITADGIEVAGANTNLRELRRHVGMVFQQFNLFPHLTAAENVMLAPTVVNKVSKAEARATAAEVLAKVGLSEKMDAYPSELSGGQQQRVAIARSLAMRPKVLLCDEITSALDPELVNEALRARRRHQARFHAPWQGARGRRAEGSVRRATHAGTAAVRGPGRLNQGVDSLHTRHSGPGSAARKLKTASHCQGMASRKGPPCWPCQTDHLPR